MSGHKVRCQCGFVFRLGPKKDKQPGVVEDLKRRRALKERKKVTRENAFDLAKPVEAKEFGGIEELEPTDLFDASDGVFEPELIEEPDLTPADPPSPLVPDPFLSELDPQHEAVLGEVYNPLELEIKDELEEVVDEPQIEIPPSTPVVIEKDESALEILDDPSLPVASTLPVAHPALDVSSSRFRADPADDEIVDAVLVDQSTGPVGVGGPIGLGAEPLQAAQPLAGGGGHLAVAAPKRRKKKRRRKSGQDLESNTGPIISLVLAVVGIPVAMVILYNLCNRFWFYLNFASSPFGFDGPGMGVGNLILPMIVFGVLSLLAFVFLVAIGISGVTAIIELVGQSKIRWAQKLLGIVAVIFLIALIFNTMYQFINVMQGISRLNEMGGNIRLTGQSTGGLFLRLFLGLLGAGLVPLAAAIIGFMRSRE